MDKSKCKIFANLQDNYDVMRLFCTECNSEDKHSHFPNRISSVMGDIKSKIEGLMIVITQVKENFDEVTRSFKPIIAHYDHQFDRLSETMINLRVDVNLT